MSDSPYAPTTAPLDKDDVTAYIVNQPTSDDKKIASFVIDDSCKNTAENHNKEATITVPFLVKKARSRDLVPRPWKSIRQLICVSYCSFLFCIITGAFANHYAWEAQRFRELGLLSEAKKLAKWSSICIYVSFALGICILMFVPLIVVCGALDMCCDICKGQ